MKAYLGLGSNLGDRFTNLRIAVERLDDTPGISVIRVSPVYKTAPIGGIEQPDFYNAAVEIETAQEPEKLLETCLRIEQEMGRTRAEKWGPRNIDIDILLFGDNIIKTDNLTVPHQYMSASG